MGAGHGPRLLAGILNEGRESIEIELRLVSPNETVAWRTNLTVAPIETNERVTDLEEGATYTLEAWLPDASAPIATAPVDTTECRGTLHLVLALSPDGSATESTRECHE